MSNREGDFFSRFQREQLAIGPREADIASGSDTKMAIYGVDRRLHPHELLVFVTQFPRSTPNSLRNVLRLETLRVQ